MQEASPERPPSTSRKPWARARFSAVAGMALVATACAGAATGVAGKGPQCAQLPSLAGLAKQLMPTVVSIFVKQVIDPSNIDPMFEFFEDFSGAPPGPFENVGEGSGVIIDPSGYIVTNHHVVEGASAVVVVLEDGSEWVAQVVGSDPPTDIALLKIEASGLAAAPLGSSETLQVGDWVIAIGNPFGLQATMTAGIVSAKGRHKVGPTAEHSYQDFIQTDAPMNPGSSGGPLFDLTGAVIGINTAINAAGQGIGFAIPVDMARPVIEALAAKGVVERSWLGVVIQELDPLLAKAFGLDGTAGALVAQVEPGSPADNAGIHPGDIVLTFDGVAIEDPTDLAWLTSTTDLGKNVKIELWRDGADETVEAKLVQAPGSEGGQIDAAAAAPSGASAKKDQGHEISLLPMDPQTASRLGLEVKAGKLPGLLVTAIDPLHPLYGAGLRPGDVILEVNGKPVLAATDVISEVDSAQGGEALLMYVIGPGGKRFVAWAP